MHGRVVCVLITELCEILCVGSVSTKEWGDSAAFMKHLGCCTICSGFSSRTLSCVDGNYIAG